MRPRLFSGARQPAPSTDFQAFCEAVFVHCSVEGTAWRCVKDFHDKKAEVSLSELGLRLLRLLIEALVALDSALKKKAVYEQFLVQETGTRLSYYMPEEVQTWRLSLGLPSLDSAFVGVSSDSESFERRANDAMGKAERMCGDESVPRLSGQLTWIRMKLNTAVNDAIQLQKQLADWREAHQEERVAEEQRVMCSQPIPAPKEIRTPMPQRKRAGGMAGRVRARLQTAGAGARAAIHAGRQHLKDSAIGRRRMVVSAPVSLASIAPEAKIPPPLPPKHWGEREAAGIRRPTTSPPPSDTGASQEEASPPTPPRQRTQSLMVSPQASDVGDESHFAVLPGEHMSFSRLLSAAVKVDLQPRKGFPKEVTIPVLLAAMKASEAPGGNGCVDITQLLMCLQHAPDASLGPGARRSFRL